MGARQAAATPVGATTGATNDGATPTTDLGVAAAAAAARVGVTGTTGAETRVLGKGPGTVTGTTGTETGTGTNVTGARHRVVAEQEEEATVVAANPTAAQLAASVIPMADLVAIPMVDPAVAAAAADTDTDMDTAHPAEEATTTVALEEGTALAR
jgi:hypothetical protein